MGEADTLFSGWAVRLAKGALDGRVRYGESAAGADALQNLAEGRTRVVVAIARAWRLGGGIPEGSRSDCGGG